MRPQEVVRAVREDRCRRRSAGGGPSAGPSRRRGRSAGTRRRARCRAPTPTTCVAVVEVEQDDVDDAVGRSRSWPAGCPRGRPRRSSGWSPRAVADLLDLLASGPDEVDPDARVRLAPGAPASAGQRLVRRSISRAVAVDDGHDRRRPGPPVTRGTRVGVRATGSPSGSPAASRAGHGRVRARSRARRSAAIGSAPPAATAASGVGLRRLPAYAAGSPSDERRRDRRRALTAAATTNSPTMIRGRLARRPVLERVDDERVPQRAIAEGLRDELRGRRRASRRPRLASRSMVVEP